MVVNEGLRVVHNVRITIHLAIIFVNICGKYISSIHTADCENAISNKYKTLFASFCM